MPSFTASILIWVWYMLCYIDSLHLQSYFCIVLFVCCLVFYFTLFHFIFSFFFMFHFISLFFCSAFVTPTPISESQSLVSSNGTANNSQISTNNASTSGITAWQLPALDCLMRMTCMALAGYIEHYNDRIAVGTSQAVPNNERGTIHHHSNGHVLPLPHNINNTPKRSDSSSNHTAKQLKSHSSGIADLSINTSSSSLDMPYNSQSSPRQYGQPGRQSTASASIGSIPNMPKVFTFPLPIVNYRNSRGAMRQTSGTGHSPVASRSSSPVFTGTHSNGIGGAATTTGMDSNNGVTADHLHRLCVTSVRLPRAEDVELLWLETIKTFADMNNFCIPEIARKSAFCLQVRTFIM